MFLFLFFVSLSGRDLQLKLSESGTFRGAFWAFSTSTQQEFGKLTNSLPLSYGRVPLVLARALFWHQHRWLGQHPQNWRAPYFYKYSSVLRLLRLAPLTYVRIGSDVSAGA